MEWIQSIWDAVIADLVVSSIVALVFLFAGAVFNALVSGRKFKQQIADLEERLSQPITTNNVTNIYQGDKSVYQGDKSVYQALNAVHTEATGFLQEDRVQEDEVVYMRKPSATNIVGDVTEIRTLTQAEYDAIAKKGDTTLYLIVDER